MPKLSRFSQNMLNLLETFAIMMTPLNSSDRECKLLNVALHRVTRIVTKGAALNAEDMPMTFVQMYDEEHPVTRPGLQADVREVAVNLICRAKLRYI